MPFTFSFLKALSGCFTTKTPGCTTESFENTSFRSCSEAAEHREKNLGASHVWSYSHRMLPRHSHDGTFSDPIHAARRSLRGATAPGEPLGWTLQVEERTPATRVLHRFQCFQPFPSYPINPISYAETIHVLTVAVLQVSCHRIIIKQQQSKTNQKVCLWSRQGNVCLRKRKKKKAGVSERI